MRKKILAAAFAICLSAWSISARAAPVAAAAMPLHFRITDLNGAATEIPAGLPQTRALLLLGFRHDDHAALDAWRAGLGLSSRETDWFEVPVIGVGNSMIRAMIVRGMRSGVTGEADRARFAPAFAEAATIARQLGVDPSAPAAVVVDRTGQVLAFASGPFDPVKGAALIHALRP